MQSVLPSDQRRPSPSDARPLMVNIGFIGVMLVVLLALRVYFVEVVPEVTGDLSAGNRLAYALKCCAPIFLLIAIQISIVSIGRLKNPSLNPLLGVETVTEKVNIRVLQNTIEQTLLFVPANCISALYFTDGRQLTLCAITVFLFLTARVIFWVGYLKSWKFRTPGMAGTAFINFVLGWYAWGNVFNDLYQGTLFELK